MIRFVAWVVFSGLPGFWVIQSVRQYRDCWRVRFHGWRFLLLTVLNLAEICSFFYLWRLR